ncbi:siderophore ABC transporter substrate-binding protein [Tianweitania sp. BSSL-BM11]|uniref:Siderophore ABC transporter substrate-binding protein n=1 Tax=Tianweitania aestuarii TaxID=2814886 RepID=A0ABS5RWN5_9HYPH|nr:siderophore ABC transporter substrate-binding protein [Tianweitania aestuarii]MBS9721478.1 siderophore ABC transporter substrate-binding protein [Tianweitania aestuarii]
MNTRRTFLAATLTGILAVASFASPLLAQEITVEHAQGSTKLASMPKKVLVFDVASLDNLDALGVEVQGMPTASMPAHLKKYEADEYEKIGSLFEPDYEAVNAAAPDLIIVGGRSRSKYAELAKLAPTIDMSTDQKDFIGSVRKNMETLGRVFGKEAEAKTELAELDAALADVKQAASGAGKGLLILTTGGKMSAYGPVSRFGVLHSAFGVTPARDDLASETTHGQPISFEFILETNPDWLFVIDRDAAIGREGQAAAQFLDNDLVNQTTAWKSEQVVYLNPSNWYLVGGGVSAVKSDAEQVTKALRKQ